MLVSSLANLANANEFIYQDWKFETGFSTGIQNASFSWSIAGGNSTSGTGPNVLSELSYQSLTVKQQNLFAILKTNDQWYLKFESDYGTIDSGFIQDSDYDGNGRSAEYSRSLSNPDGSKIFGLESTLNYFLMDRPHFQLEVLGGFFWKHQTFEKSEGEQVISTPGRTPRQGNIEGLNSHYKASWYGPTVGLNPQLKYENHRFSLIQSLYWSQYYAEADWNLRSDFAHPKSFEHNANGFGIKAQLEYQWLVHKNLDLRLSYKWEHWQTKEGTDTLFLASGRTLKTQLNEAQWKSQGFSLGLDWKF